MSADSLAARYQRLTASVQHLQLMTRTFATLELTERKDLADTLSALTGSLLECRARFALLLEGDGLEVAAHGGVDQPWQLLSEPGRALWQTVMIDRIPRTFAPASLRERWPEAPPALCEGLACVAIALHDEPIGILAVAGKLSRQPFNDEELTFLACAAGLAAMTIASANLHARRDIERRRAEARAEREKLAEVRRQLAVIEAQKQQIAELSVPILQVRDKVLAVPILGALDVPRADALMLRLLDAIAQRDAWYVILDLTGVEAVDSYTADHFIEIAQAAELLGATCMLTGVQPTVALALVALGADLSSIIAHATLGDGLEECIRQLAARRR